MRAYFDIYGLPLEVTADHPLLFECLVEDLKHFQVSARRARHRAIRLALAALPTSLDGATYPPQWLPYQELAVRKSVARRTMVTCYGRSAIIVLLNVQQRRVDAGVIPDPAFIPDPLYHLCFSQPIGPWLKLRGLFPVHAGCVALGSRGILIIGTKRAGKSTLSLSAVRDGFAFLSDEQPLLSLAGGRVWAHALPRRIRLDRPVARRFPELKPLLEATTDARIAFPIDAVWPQSLARSCQPRLLIFPRFQATGTLRLTPLAPTAALGRLLQDDHFVWYRNGPWHRCSHAHLTLFERLVRQTLAFTLTYGPRNISHIPRLFRQLLEASSLRRMKER